MKYKYNTGGGLSSLPKRTTLRGQDHMLSYITPEEARMLRQQGGGVTPTGGQYRGPGGVPAFLGHGGHAAAQGGNTGNTSPGVFGGGTGSGMFGGTTSNPASAAQAAAAAPPGTVGHHGGIATPPVSYSPYGNINAQIPGLKGFDTNAGIANSLGMISAAKTFSKLQNVPPFLTFYDDGKFDIKGYKDALADAGLAEGEVSKANVISNQLSRDKFQGDPGGFFGESKGLTDSNTGENFGMEAIANADPSEFSGTGKFAGSNISPTGDANSPFASVVAGITGLTPIGLAATVMGTVGEAFSGEPNPFGIQGSIRSFDKGLQSLTGLSLSGDTTSNSTSNTSPVSESKSPSLGLGPKSQSNNAPRGFSRGPNIPQQSSPIVQQGLAATALPPPPTTVVDEEETISQIPTSLSGIRNRYIGAATGGGIQGLINRQNTDYGVANQDSFVPGKDAFQRRGFTPNQELMDSSYVDNIMKGHTVPMGMHSAQQPNKPFEPFPSGGQMNTDNTQYADYSKAQSNYSMPNMNRVT